MNPGRTLSLAASPVLVALAFYLVAFVAPAQKSTWHQFAIVIAAIALVGFAFLLFTAATMAP